MKCEFILITFTAIKKMLLWLQCMRLDPFRHLERHNNLDRNNTTLQITTFLCKQNTRNYNSTSNETNFVIILK